MKIICKWIFKEYRPGVKTPQMGGKQKDISGMTGDEVLNMITTLMAQAETVRLIFEEEK